MSSELNSTLSAADMARKLVNETAPGAFTINPETALYQTAQERNLGYPKTDELYFELGGVRYVAQGYSEGILYVEVGKWDQIQQA